MYYGFEWDPEKAKTNRAKHGLTFEQAATVFLDPNQVSIYDETHSDPEERWITLGAASDGLLTVVVHTYREIEPDTVRIRIISARRATRSERQQYQEFE